jgi:predicted ATPase
MKVMTARYRFGPFSLDTGRDDLRQDGNRVPPVGAQPLALLAVLLAGTGAGGMGKTRLALEFVAEHAADPLNKILFLGLEGLRQRDQIVIRLAARLGLQLTDEPQPARNLAEALRRQPCFLVLDNCKHLLVEVAAIAEIILAHAPGVTILATNREPLKTSFETIFPLAPLEVPQAGAKLTAAEIASFAAIRLFTSHMPANQSGFGIDVEPAQLRAPICRKLDGIPLALQPAAAGLQSLRLPELLAGLSARRRPPLSAPPGFPAQHRTVEATIAWSVSLLSDTERTAFCWFGVFAGVFSPNGAVVAGGALAASKIPDLSISLCEKSLLASIVLGRFQLLESTRLSALDMLAASGEAGCIRRALAVLMVAKFSRARDIWQDTDAESWVEAHDPDIEDLRASLD